ncbi:MAG: glycosyltransferase family 32 protein [Parachlamydiaceae bacterium]
MNIYTSLIVINGHWLMKNLDICLIFLLTLAIGNGYCDNKESRDPFIYSEKMLKKLNDLENSETGFLPVSFWQSMQANRPLANQKFLKNHYLKMTKERFELFLKEFQSSKIKSDTFAHFSIPPHIHLIWLGSPPPKEVNIAINSWKKHHPKWIIQLWTDEDIAAFNWTSPRSEEIFLKGKNWAEKSDILRFEILYQFGGIYTDIDVICLKAFDDLMTQGLTCFCCLEIPHIDLLIHAPLIGSAIIGAAQYSEVMRQCMEYTQTEKEAPGIPQYIRSGPGPLSKACFKALENRIPSVLILPCSYFFPLPWTKRLTSFDGLALKIKPESFAIHLWEFSWKAS